MCFFCKQVNGVIMPMSGDEIGGAILGAMFLAGVCLLIGLIVYGSMHVTNATSITGVLSWIKQKPATSRVS